MSDSSAAAADTGGYSKRWDQGLGELDRGDVGRVEEGLVAVGRRNRFDLIRFVPSGSYRTG